MRDFQQTLQELKGKIYKKVAPLEAVCGVTSEPVPYADREKLVFRRIGIGESGGTCGTVHGSALRENFPLPVPSAMRRSGSISPARVFCTEKTACLCAASRMWIRSLTGRTVTPASGSCRLRSSGWEERSMCGRIAAATTFSGRLRRRAVAGGDRRLRPCAAQAVLRCDGA